MNVIIGVSDLLYERARINQATESIEVIEKRSRVIHDEMSLDNRLLCRAKVMVAMDNIVRKNAGKVITLLSPAGGARALHRDALEQRNLRQIVEDTLHELISYIERVEKLLIMEVKGPNSVR